MLYILLLTLFILGLAFGSFLNAFEYRLFNNKDWINERSHCPNCKHNLSVLDLIPVFSWFFLCGKCRYCEKKISWQYPVVEFVMGILFAGYGWVLFSAIFEEQIYFSPRFSDIMNLIFGLIVIWSLVFFTIYDLKYGLIPDKVLFPLIFITIFRNVILTIYSEYPFEISSTFFNHLLVAVVASSFFFFIIYFTKGKGMGGGDMKFAFWIGLLLGGVSTLLSLYLSFVIGGVYGAIILLLKKKQFGQTIPFGPFLCLGTIIVFCGQEELIDWANDLLFGGLLY